MCLGPSRRAALDAIRVAIAETLDVPIVAFDVESA